MESIAVYSFIKGQLSHTATNVSTPLHSFAPLLFPSFLRFHYLAALAPFPTLSLLFYITSDFHSHFGATSAVLFMETEPRHVSFLHFMSLAFDLHIDWHHGATTDRRPAEVRQVLQES